MIFDELADAINEARAVMTANQVARLFGRSRAAIYDYEMGCTFRCDPNFVAGLKALGYEIIIRKKENK